MSNPFEKYNYMDMLKEINNQYNNMKKLRPIPADSVKYFFDEFAISDSYSSNAIEGNTFTYDETRLLIKEGVVFSTHSFDEHQDIVGYKEAFSFLYNSTKENRIIDEEFILKIHSFVLNGRSNAGTYRKEQVYIGDPFKVKYMPPSAIEVPTRMENYIKDLQQDFVQEKEIVNQTNIDWETLFRKLATHHIEFENIHPFIDGNGRTGRLLLSYEMISLGLLPVDIRYENREHYYAAFTSYREKEKYGSREDSKTDKMAKLLVESECASMKLWNDMFKFYLKKNTGDDKSK